MRLNDFTVPGTELTVTGNLRIETEDLGGQTSGTDRANKGIKPKTLTVSLLILKKHAGDLTDLVKVAEAEDGAGKLRVYDIVEDTARAMNVRQVQFTGAFVCKDLSPSQAWRVSFTLAEYLSVAEKTEQRRDLSQTEVQQATGETIAAQEETPAEGETLTGFETFLSKVDKALA
ncbi:DNA-binding protein [Hahella sp. CR1]|uniref:baseplate complex protein n=1 Tax=Hahella sp. CR1 TaxID=2992807 RepID=UPI00244152A1|nr:DNA-binding protein [Hahella sp. CR1]MDG9666717.1 DNA-binding protein [Hahella sp. CR1]